MASIWPVNPLQSTRWAQFVSRHRRASVFHTSGWMEALHRTYGYEPVVLTTAGPEEDLQDGLPVCRVRSWIFGCRTVSLPFSDHCEPLADTHQILESLLSGVKQEIDVNKGGYLELRPFETKTGAGMDLQTAQSFCHHRLGLNRSLDELFSRFHRNCVQRKIGRAERAPLDYEEGRSESLLQKFYSLLVATRRRHQLPPQPLGWFVNLIAYMGDMLKIRVVSDGRCPVAGMVTLSHKATLVYKYGCSDARFHHLGGMQLLFWRAIQDAKEQGLTEFDLGRTDWDNEGLLRFKDRLGATRSTLTYYRYPASAASDHRFRVPKIVRRICAHLPESFLIAAGNRLYKHFG